MTSEPQWPLMTGSESSYNRDKVTSRSFFNHDANRLLILEIRRLNLKQMKLFQKASAKCEWRSLPLDCGAFISENVFA